VAQVELRSRRQEDEVGTLIEIDGSKVKNQAGCSCPAGTSVHVKNLFYNVPARRKFLKSDNAELKHILDEFFRVALIYNQVRFNYYQDNKLVYQLIPANRKQRIVSLFGANYSEKLVPVEQKTEDVSLSGFIGKPEFAKKTRGEQFFFVNGRFIRHPYLNHALENAYKELIPKDTIPTYFIFFEVDPSSLDVNIHPTKTEVNFIDSKVIYAVLKSSVRKALGIHNLTPSIDFDVEQSIDFSQGLSRSAPKNPFDKPPSNYNPFEPSKDFQLAMRQAEQRKRSENWESLLDLSNVPVQPANGEQKTIQDESWDFDRAEQKSSFFQLANQYIVTSIKSGLVVIHQERAHERILYEQYLEMLEQEKAASQQELFPQQLVFPLSDATLLEEMMDDLSILGFRLNKLGINTFVLTGTPAETKETSMQALLEEMLDHYKKNMINFNADQRINLARSMANSVGIKAGRKLHQEEMGHLVDELFSCAAPEWTPDGKRVYTIISSDAIKSLLDKSL